MLFLEERMYAFMPYLIYMQRAVPVLRCISETRFTRVFAYVSLPKHKFAIRISVKGATVDCSRLQSDCLNRLTYVRQCVIVFKLRNRRATQHVCTSLNGGKLYAGA